MAAPTGESVTGAVLMPVKSFELAKGRLHDALEPDERARLARHMATRVVQAQPEDLPVIVCCDDEGVAAWAGEHGADISWSPGTDLNGAVSKGRDHARETGISHVVVTHSDLPLAGSLRPLLGWPGVTIVPDRHGTGTNVLATPTELDFTFAYGAGSFLRHVREAVRHRRGMRVLHDPRLAWDIDEPEDLHLPDGTTLTADALEKS